METWPTADGAEFTNRLYAKDCATLIARGRGRPSSTCNACRKCEKDLLRCNARIEKEISPRKLDNYSLADFRRVLEEKNTRIVQLSLKLHESEERVEKFRRRQQRPAAIRCVEILEAELGTKTPSIPVRAAAFLRQQFLSIAATDSHGIRWNRDFVVWAMRLFAKSAAAYEFIRDSGSVRLPSPRTLGRYFAKLPKCSGLNDTVVAFMVHEYFTYHPQPYARYLAMSLDEMKIRANIVYDKRTDQMVGFVDSTETVSTFLCIGFLSLINFLPFQMNALEPELQPDADKSHLIATDVLVVFIRGIATGFQRAVAWFPVRRLTAGEIMSIIWTTKQRLEFLSFKDGYPRFKLLSITCDGLAANHLFFKLHGADTSQLQYKAKDPFDPDNFVYFLIDPPHLMKTMKNNLEKSSTAEDAIKTLEYRLPMLWAHVEEIYLEDVQNTWRYVHFYFCFFFFNSFIFQVAAEIISSAYLLDAGGSDEGQIGHADPEQQRQRRHGKQTGNERNVSLMRVSFLGFFKILL